MIAGSTPTPEHRTGRTILKPLRKAKIVATLGPASDGGDRLDALFAAGVDVVRLNFSHGSRDAHRDRFERVRAAAERAGKAVAVLADLSGPKMRVGRFPDGSTTLVEGAEVRLVYGDAAAGDGEVAHNYAALAADVETGQSLYFDDGKLRLEVVATDGDAVVARVRVGGTLEDAKGMNLPETALSTPALTDKDRDDALFANELDVDYLALSFVRSAADVRAAKEVAGGTPVIAKIERPEAVENLTEILDAADGAMVARGDLGVEIGHEKVPAIQKLVIRECVARAIPVITATEMLDSMIDNPAPTRAEVSDVANAVLDGTDAVMLSGETAVGRHPVAAVRMMDSIIRATEGSNDLPPSVAALPDARKSDFSSAIAVAAVKAADKLGLAALAVYTESGAAAVDVSCLRPLANIVAFSRHNAVLRRLALQWGVLPLFGAQVDGVTDGVAQACAELRSRGLASPGESIAVTLAMRPDDGEEWITNTLKLHRLR